MKWKHFLRERCFLYFFSFSFLSKKSWKLSIGHSKDVEFWLVHMKINWIEERWKLLFLHLIMLMRVKNILFTNSVAAEVSMYMNLYYFSLFLKKNFFHFVFGEIVIKVDFENFSVSVPSKVSLLGMIFDWRSKLIWKNTWW